MVRLLPVTSPTFPAGASPAATARCVGSPAGVLVGSELVTAGCEASTVTLCPVTGAAYTGRSEGSVYPPDNKKIDT